AGGGLVCGTTMDTSESEKLRVRAVLENVPVAIDCVTKSARAAGFDEGVLYRIQVAVDEACANVVQHAYRGIEVGDMEICCDLDETGLVIRVRDWGRSFDPDLVEDPNVEAPLEERTTGGLGIFLIRQYMDETRYSFDPEKGNELVMAKRKDGSKSRGDALPAEGNGFKRQLGAILAERRQEAVDDPALICAAVLIPLLFKDGEWHVLVTQRAETVEHHKGQISFPGGACEAQDPDLRSTALRETFEEIGIPPDKVEVLGVLDDYPTISSFVVTPVVGVIPHPFAYRLSKNEVEAVVEVPVSFLRDPANLRVEQREHQGTVLDVLFWDYDGHTIWGATAQMLKGLIDLVA
ncbi:ATP-binding protein, partial [Chloroflexota bacterium]